MRYVIAPGYQDSGADHWQTLWQRDLGSLATRVRVASWAEPEHDDWVSALDAAMTPGAVIIAHSLGCLAAISWLELHQGVAAGAFLVATPDPEGADFPAAISGFERPARPLADPVVMVSSTNDPYSQAAFARRTAAVLGASLVEVGPLGHINPESRLGDWPAGRRLLADFVAGLRPTG